MIASPLMIQNINKISIFSALTELEIKELLNYASYEEYKENQLIFNENDPGSSLYIVINGKVKIFRVLSDNTIHEISNFSDNEVFGEMSFMDSHVRSANAQALCETSLVKLSSDSFEHFSQAFPAAAFRFHKNLITEIQQRLRKTNDRYSYHIIWGKTMKTALAKNYEELLQSNIELSASHNFLYNVINSSGDIIFALDDKLAVILFNAGAEKALKHKSDEYAGRPAEGLFYSAAEFREFIKNISERKSLEDIEINLKTRSGLKIVAAVSAFILSPDTGAGVFGEGIVVVARDITQKKALENQYIHNEKMIFLGRAVSEIIHDIKNPLTIIQLSKDSLRLRLEDYCSVNGSLDKEMASGFDKIDESVERIQHIIINTLEYSRAVPGKKCRIDLAEVAAKSIELSKIHFKKSGGAGITLNVPKSPVFIEGNFQQIEQVFVNLIINAIQALKEEETGLIEVTVELSGAFAQVAVKDNGCGISEENLLRIFEPFFTIKQDYKGTGLGLSICQAIVLQHNGRIDVENIASGGSIFIVKIPAA